MKSLKYFAALVLLACVVSGASASDVQFSFTDSGGSKVDYFPSGYNGLVVTRAEITDDNAFYNDWQANLVEMDVKCYFYPVNGMTLETQHMKIGCHSAGGSMKTCARYVTFDIPAGNIEGGRVECLLNGNRYFDEKIPFGAPQPPPTPPSPPASPPPTTQPAQPASNLSPVTQPSLPPGMQPNVTQPPAAQPPSTQPIAPPQNQQQQPSGLPCVPTAGLILLLGLLWLKRD